MKKVFAVLLAVVMTLSSFCVYGADYSRVFDAFFNTVYSGELEFDAKAELNKPLLIADVINGFLVGNETPVDMRLMLESLAGAALKGNCTYEVSKDMKKADMKISFQITAPLVINENLKLDSWSEWDVWIKYDFISENPVYTLIYKVPFSPKYMVLDMSEAIRENGLDIQSYMPNMTQTEKMNQAVVESYKKNAVISKNGDVYKLKFDDKGFKNVLIDIFEVSFDVVMEQYTALGMDEADIESGNSAIEEAKKVIEEKKDMFSILGKDGLEIDLKLNKSGIISEQKTRLNIGINIYDIMTAFESGAEAETFGITKENSNIDFTVELGQKLARINQKIKVDYPVLTDENIVDLSGISQTEAEYHSKYNYFSVIDDEMPVVKNGVPYIKLRDTVNCCPFELSYENGAAYVDTASSNGIIEIKANAAEIVKGGEIIPVKNKALEIGGSIYVSNEILSYMNVEISDFNYNLETGETYAYGVYEDPDFVEEIEYYEETETDEIPEFYCVDGDGREAMIENGVIYIPFNPLMGEQNVGAEEITASNGEIRVNSLNAFGFKEIKLYENSLYAEKDSEKILLENPVRFVRGEYWVGSDFADRVLSSRITSIYYSERGSMYDFQRYEK